MAILPVLNLSGTEAHVPRHTASQAELPGTFDLNNLVLMCQNLGRRSECISAYAQNDNCLILPNFSPSMTLSSGTFSLSNFSGTFGKSIGGQVRGLTPAHNINKQSQLYVELNKYGIIESSIFFIILD